MHVWIKTEEFFMAAQASCRLYSDSLVSGAHRLAVLC
jgi:hypothetical protein